MFQTKVVGKIKTHILCSVTLKNHAIYETMWKNIAQPNRPQMTWHMHTACWITKATNTHPEYVTIIAFTQQQWLYKST
jgi:hypothetical protein